MSKSLRAIASLTLTTLLMTGNTVKAGPYGDELTRCFVGHTKEDDQKTLIRWIVSAFAANSSVEGLIVIDQSQLPSIQKAMGDYVNRIFLKDCLLEAREAARYEGNHAVTSAFTLVAQIAGREAMKDSGTEAMLEKYFAYVDLERLEREILGE